MPKTIDPTAVGRKRRQFLAGPANLKAGETRILELAGKSIGIFNVDGRYFALHNRCPHMAGSLCEGPVSGTTFPTDTFEYHYGREGEIVRCGWHGWEFEIATGQCLVDEKIRARTYEVGIENGILVVYI